MKIRDIIETLSSMNPDEEIVIAWWERNTFPQVKDEDWNEAASVLEGRMDWSNPHALMEYILEDKGYV
tara:strand:- start:833 stop:1036 length:204 start_codon:yes stop_codon:yes gene_type:complete